MKNRALMSSVGIAIFSARLLSGAEETEVKKTDAESLPPVVVTATKTETEVSKTAASITVIDRAKIDQEQYRLMTDALRSVPGLTIANRGGPGTQATVLMRGTKSEHTSVLIDGRPMPTNLAGLFNLETTPLDNVERIEVLRGPAASLYGGKTIGGVINIITRTGRGLEKPENTVFFEAGSYGTFREGLSSLGSVGDLDWAFELGRTDIQGQRINSQVQQTSGSGRIGYQIDETLRFDLDLRSYESIVGSPGNRLQNRDDDQVRTEFWSVSPRLVWDTTDIWKQTLTYSYSRSRQVAINAANNGLFAPPDNRLSVTTQFLEYQSEIKALDWWTITAGAWLQDLSYTRFNDTAGLVDIDQNETNWALFVQSQMEITKDLTFLTGVRYDSYSDFDDAATWRAGLSYRVPVLQTLLHANYGTAFSPPSPQDRELVLFGNPLLAKPERSRGFEIGFEQPISAAKASFSATYFQNDLRDTYQFDLATFALQPIGEARTRGVELGAVWQPCTALGFNASYTYLDADDTEANVRLVRRPRQSISGGMTLKPHEDVTVSLSADYVMDREDFDPVSFAQTDLEDYLVARLALNWRVCKNVELFGRIENLFGDRYEEVAGFPAYSTGAYAGVKLRF